jgi:Zn-dependent M16 (insulinase) family peptidase
MIASSFALVDRRPVPALGLEVSRFRHPCGAEHWHLGCSDEHRAFVVAFRTPPHDSTGLPHILEHTTLCGSRRFPVRDPFFNMLRRSLQTFMNALTYPDLTAYPFATQVAKDYDNLLAVYLDAVFSPNLHPLDFAQEGHRLEPAGKAWARKGVVYNEMKGAMDSTDAQLESARERTLLSDTIYRHNSGGEPADIPRLTHRDLVEFHRRCYRPANACFVTYGQTEPERLHTAIAAYIGEDAGVALPPPAPSRLAGPFTELDVPVPLAEGQDALDATAISLTWMQQDASELDEVLACELIDRLLLGHAGAPLRKALEGSGLGRSTGSSGYSSGYRSGLFTAELEGIAEEDYGKFPALVDSCLAEVVGSGFARSEVDAALHQLELARREISGDHYPFGLELCFRMLAPWNWGSDPLPFLDQAQAIERLRATATGEWAVREVRSRLVDDRRRLLMRARPDRTFHERQQTQERTAVDADLARLDQDARLALTREAEALAERQARKDDPGVLPDLELADVPRERHWPEGRGDEQGTLSFHVGTNGILHQIAAWHLPLLSETELDLLPLLPRLIGSLGVGKLDYDEQAARLNAVCGGVWAWLDIVADPEDERRARGFFLAETKGLASRESEFMPLLAESLHECRFDERARLRELVDEALQRLQGSVQQQGNRLAARAAMRGFSGAAGLPHRLHGLGRLARLKRLAASVAEDAPKADDQLAALGERLQALLARVIGAERHLAVIGDSADRALVLATVHGSWSMPTPGDPASTVPFAPPKAEAAKPTAYATATAVNYCALAFPAVTFAHPDAAALSVAGALLTNNVLHPKLREQGGAYGGSAGFQATNAAFALTSYRDPRLKDTFADMREGLRWLAACPDDRRLLKEAILGVIAGLDAPASPAGEARNRFTGDLKGMGPALVNAHRRRVLAVAAEDVRRAAARWLPAEGGSTAVVTSAENAEKSGMGWTVEPI